MKRLLPQAESVPVQTDRLANKNGRLLISTSVGGTPVLLSLSLSGIQAWHCRCEGLLQTLKAHYIPRPAPSSNTHTQTSLGLAHQLALSLSFSLSFFLRWKACAESRHLPKKPFLKKNIITERKQEENQIDWPSSKRELHSDITIEKIKALSNLALYHIQCIQDPIISLSFSRSFCHSNCNAKTYCNIKRKLHIIYV